jgi:two-component system, NarL family, sensor histidine kinase DegS
MVKNVERDEITSTDPKQEIISLLTTEMGTLKRRLGEIKAQIDQQQTMVDREQHRNSDIAAELQTISANLDTIPREDIKSKYDDALDARFRLATMRGQLEKFQANYEQLQKEQSIIGQILTKFQGVEFGEEGQEEGDSSQRGGGVLNIVRIVQAQEEERQRLARQMHDGPAQSLTNFILQAEICQRLFDRNPARAGEELNNLKTAASVTFQKVRDFIFDLRPMMLDDLGVVPTVRRYVASFKEKSDIQVDLEIAGEERRLETHREVMLFRGIQELLVNARDYAQATQMKIRLDMSGKRIRILIEDNGRGFDPELIASREETQDARVQAIITLKEKYELIGGAVMVSSNETEGTTVRLELPSGE